VKIGFDIISDLYLSPEDSFNWENKATSLYCIIAGNISNDLRTIRQTLLHLGERYQGIFYIPGHLEYTDSININTRTDQLKRIVESVKNVAILHHHVVVVDGIAIVGASCWYDSYVPAGLLSEVDKEIHRSEDHTYLLATLTKIQLHVDVKKVILVTGSLPSTDFYFGKSPENVKDLVPPCVVLLNDTENKTTHWVYGNSDRTAELVKDDITYISNPYLKQNPYWAKRIEL
jgi:predicted phosphohydrolase